MKKTFLLASTLLMIFACSKDELSNTNDSQGTSVSLTGRHCASQDVLERQIKENPNLVKQMELFETLTERAISEGRLVNGQIQIPVVVNVLYKTAAENISLAQIQSQIDIF